MSAGRADQRSSMGAVRQVLEGPIVQIAARLFLAGVFLWAAIPKIGDPAAFAQDIANYRILPGSLVHPAAVAIPWIELFTAVLLVLGIWTRAAALVCGAMLLIFTVGIAAAVARGLDIECGCFGQSGSGDKVGWGTVARDAAFLLPAVAVIGFDRGRYGLVTPGRRLR